MSDPAFVEITPDGRVHLRGIDPRRAMSFDFGMPRRTALGLAWMLVRAVLASWRRFR